MNEFPEDSIRTIRKLSRSKDPSVRVAFAIMIESSKAIGLARCLRISFMSKRVDRGPFNGGEAVSTRSYPEPRAIGDPRVNASWARAGVDSTISLRQHPE